MLFFAKKPINFFFIKYKKLKLIITSITYLNNKEITYKL